MNIDTLFQQASLAEASYANFWDEVTKQTITNDAKVQTALITMDNGFSQTQAADFTKHWKVISHQPDTNSGFSGTLFKNIQTDEYVFANRGTVGFLTDIVSARRA